MNSHHHRNSHNNKQHFGRIILFFQLVFSTAIFAQEQSANPVAHQIFSTDSSNINSSDIFGSEKLFVENVGQYGDDVVGFQNMGKILFGYDGFEMPVLFTAKGIIYLQRKIKTPSEEQKEKYILKGLTPEQISAKNKITERTVTMTWGNSNPSVTVSSEELSGSYNTYGTLLAKARTFKKIIYKEIYPGIDIEYYFPQKKEIGFEYKIIVKSGADVNKLKMIYSGDVKNVRTNNAGNLLIRSSLGTLTETKPISYYSDDATKTINTPFIQNENEVKFTLPLSLDPNRTFIIDPFITGTANLTGGNAGKAKDVDFDYAGNIYVSGGGDFNSHKLAKYNPAGVLQWTFSGTLLNPTWTFGPYYGGWVVDKNNGNTYLGQGFNFTQGFIIVRINTGGLYDNYVSAGNPNFREDWKMIWSCNSGSPQIIIAGGGTNSNINLGICSPPSTSITASNITNIPSIAFQDMADMVIDPVSNSMYTLYASGSVPTLNNSIYKNNSPYSSASIAWNTPSGYIPLQEAANRPYLQAALIDNSTNILAINPNYLFYWDGKNLKAFDKLTGAVVGTPLTLPANATLFQGGVVADACNNVFIGSINGTIKVYNFNGSVFNDAPADIFISGFTTSSVYDLAYNETQKLIYASGDGFVASFDITPYGCVSASYALTVTPNCSLGSASTAISPIPPVGSTVTYTLMLGSTQIASNTTGTFTGLLPQTNYNIVATINQACSGVQTSINFTLPGPAISTSNTNVTCGNAIGTITASGTGGVSPYTFSIDGSNFFASGTFNTLSAGIYTVTIKDQNGCKTTSQVLIQNTNGPIVTSTKTDATCGNSTGTITANGTGINQPFEYSVNGINYQSSNFFTGLTPGTYTLTIRDTTGCSNFSVVTINAGPSATLTATPGSSTCGQANGMITAFGSGGTAPLLYSVNGNSFQAGNNFANLSAGVYVVTMEDANGCIKTTNVTVANIPGPTLTATTTTASCNFANGTITANGSGGTAPIQYSLNASTSQIGNTFVGLAPGIYIVTARDANGCTATTSVTINSTNSPSITATSTPSACNGSTGTIVASGSGGAAPLSYSINGFTFQASTTFTSVAAGVYFVLVKDAGNCTSAYPLTVSNTASPTISATVTSATCNAVDGTISATGLGGTAPLQFNINGGAYQTSNVFTALNTGPYLVTVKDANGCLSSTNVTIASTTGLTLTTSTISTNCSVSNGGTINATATGNNPPLQYSINGVTYQASSTFTGVSTGTYTVYVRDAFGCVLTKSASVASTFGPSITAVSTNSTCASNSGTITASATGGTGSLQFTINGTTYQSSNFFTNVAPGTYNVTVKDASGCTATTSVTITNVGVGPGITTFTVVVKGSFPCNGNSFGKITNPRVNGANCGSCTFSLDGGAFIANSTQLFLNVPQGNHTVTAKDANGCTKTLSLQLGLAAISTATTVVTGAACGTTNGSIALTGVGVNTPYHASINGIGGPWNTFASTFTFSGLAPGVYTITMADDESFVAGPPDIPGGCISTLTVIVPSIGGPSLSVTKTDGTCNLNNGTITALGSGGSAPLTYSIDNVTYQASGNFTGLAGGTYSVTVKDATGCISSSIVTVVSPGLPIISATATGTTCSLPNGTILAAGSGGTAPLSYSINGLVFQSSTSFANLASGSYTVYAKDVNGCYSTTTASITTVPRPQVTAFSVPTSCGSNNGVLVATGTGVFAPFQYSIDGSTYQSSNIFSFLNAGAYTVTIKDSTGCTNALTLNVGNIGAPTLTLTATSATCSGSNGTIIATGVGGIGTLQYSKDGSTFQAGSSFAGLAAGPFIITVMDANGCLATKTISVGNLPGPQTLSASIVNAKCGLNNGSITATATGGVPPLQYSIDGITFQASTLFSSLAGGGYILTVKDANSCTKTLSLTVQNLTGPTITTTSTNASCYKNDGTITALPVGGTVALSFSKNGTIYQASNVFTNLATGTYTITIKDANNCLNTSTATINALPQPTITATVAAFPCGSTIKAIATGVPQLEYSMDSLLWQSADTFPCILQGTYQVFVRDANNCINKTTIAFSNPLPVELLSFIATKKENEVELNWETASEINNDYFSVQSSTNAIDFKQIGIVQGAGNSTELNSYSFLDHYPLKGINYYRLKQIDFDGKFAYSDIVAINFDEENLSAIYFDELRGEYYFKSPMTEDTHAEIVSVNGMLVKKLELSKEKQHLLNIGELASGVYIFRINHEGVMNNYKFVKR